MFKKNFLGFEKLFKIFIGGSLGTGPQKMAFFGNVVGNIQSLVSGLGGGGLAGLVAVGIILWLFGRK